MGLIRYPLLRFLSQSIGEGGEKQRISIARAMLKDASIVMDKATANVDPENENRIVQKGKHEELIGQKGIYHDFVLGRKEAIGWKREA